MSKHPIFLKNLVKQLLIHGKIKTTLPRAKALKEVIDRIIIRQKKNTVRKSGFTRILKLGHRLGDNAQIALIELVDWQEKVKVEKVKEKKIAKKPKRAVKKKTNE